MKSVLMVYPVKEYIDNTFRFDKEGLACYANSLALGRLGEFWSSALNLQSGEFRQRFRIINRLIDEYRGAGFDVSWLFFGKEERKETPNKKAVSDIFEIQKRDLILSAGITLADINAYKYPDENQIILELKGLTKLVVGGFHKADCVKRFSTAAGKLGIESEVDGLLTEEFFGMVMASFQQDLFAKQIREGYLDPEMHEDDPEEIKRLELGDRISKYL